QKGWRLRSGAGSAGDLPPGAPIQALSVGGRCKRPLLSKPRLPNKPLKPTPEDNRCLSRPPCAGAA
ncbi:MAG: hypothetical protein ACRER2_07790, partial [Methylococcales bacterium]